MSTEISKTEEGSTELQLVEGQRYFTPQQLDVLNTLGLKNPSPGELTLFFDQCVRTGLDPFAKQIYLVPRGGRHTIQTGIDGFRLIAQRAARRDRVTYGYSDTLWADESGQWFDLWLDRRKQPSAAKVTVFRDGQAFPAIAMWAEYGSEKNLWKTMPAHMLAKVAEALALRKAFPQDLSGLYAAEEMDQAPAPQDAPAQAASTPQAAPQQPSERKYGIRANMPQTGTQAPQAATAEQVNEVYQRMSALGYDQQTGPARISGFFQADLTGPEQLSAEEARTFLADLHTEAQGRHQQAEQQAPPADTPLDGLLVDEHGEIIPN